MRPRLPVFTKLCLIPLLLTVLSIPVFWFSAGGRSNPWFRHAVFELRKTWLGERLALPSWRDLDSLSGASLAGVNADLETASPILPSVQGPQSDLFTGAGTFSLPLKLPAGRGGLGPSLSLSYSSGAVDDFRLGTYHWYEKYQRQGSWVGFGWNLGGLGYIIRDERLHPEDLKKVAYYLVFPGGSTRIINLQGDEEHYWDPEWGTNPNLFLKIEHNRGNCYAAHDTDSWVIYAKDGTKYIFGDDLGEGCFPSGAHYPDGALAEEAGTATPFRLHNSVNDEGQGNTKLVPNKWLLRKIVDTHGNEITIGYASETKRINCHYGQVAYQVRASYPQRIAYNGGRTVVEFVREPRPDYEIGGYDNSCLQNYWGEDRLEAIQVKTQDENDNWQLVRRYELSYEQSLHRQGHPDEPGHSLLTSVQEFGRGGAEALPPHTFEYYQEGDYRFNNTLLESVSNGYGMRVTYNYTPLVNVAFCDSHNGCNLRRWGAVRNRLDNQVVADGLGNSYQVSYDYGEMAAYVKEQGDPAREAREGCLGCYPFSGFEFLGHAWAKQTTSALNNYTVAKRVAVTYFHQKQATNTPGAKCFQVDLRKGMSYKTEVLDPSDGQVLSKTETQTIPALNSCDPEFDYYKGPATFVYQSQVDSHVFDSETVHTRVTYPSYDEYGNLWRQVSYGDLSREGDERYTDYGYVYNPEKWIVGKQKLVQAFSGLPGDGEELSRTGFAYDGLGWGEPPTRGDLTFTDQTDFSNETHLVTRATFDGFGNPISQTDPNGNTATTEYDPLYNLYPVKVTNPLGHTVETEYDYVLGVPKKVTDANGVAVRVTYDSFGRRKKILKPGDVEDFPSLEFGYQDGAPAVVSTATKVDDVTRAFSWQIYNGWGQLIQGRAQAEVGGELKDLLVTSKYDSLGHKVGETQPYAQARFFNAGGRFPSYTEEGYAEAPKSASAYDVLGRVVSSRDALGRVVTTEYLGWQTRVTDPNGQQSSSTVDAYGNLVRAVDALGNTTTYEYNGRDQLIKVTAPSNVTTSISYDSLGRKTAMDDPDLGHWTYDEYDNNGNLLVQTDAKGQTIRLGYDALNRLVKKLYPDGSAIEYEYDQGPHAKGRRTKMTDLTGSTEYFYDERGRLIREHKVIGEEAATTEFGYDSTDTLVQVIYPDGEVVRSDYNSVGQLEGVVGEDIYLGSAFYNELGAVTALRLGDTSRTAYEYDLTGRLNQIWVRSAREDLQRLDYQQDAVGNITSVADLLNPEKSLSFFYDNLYRLAGSQGHYATAYDYDAVGNMLSKVEGDEHLEMLYTDPAHTHAPKIVNGFEYQYDANGNLVEDEVRCLEWDYDNKPVRIIVKETPGEIGCADYFSGAKSGQTTEFAYDGDGSRVLKRVLGGATAAAISLRAGWNSVVWPEASSSAAGVARVLEDRCGSGAIARSRPSFWDAYHAGWGGRNFGLSTGASYYFRVPEDCSIPLK